MKRLKLLFAAFALLLGGANSVNAQGTWTAPSVPGIDPSTADGSTTCYLYNIGADAFVTYGMSWNTQAIARRLNDGDQEASSIHKMTVSVDGTSLKFHFNDITDANRLLSDNGNATNCYVDTWTGTATQFTYEATTPEGAYKLKNNSTSNYLDVDWKYGGHLTGTGGQGFTAWAIIPETSITDGSYAKYKERTQMYGVYQALVSADVVSSYTDALNTANAVYVNSNATVAELRSATRTLINAAAEDIASSVNGNSLFDDADMWGNQAITTWTSTAPTHKDYGEYETYDIKYDFNQTHDVPNGSYKIIFHSLFRNDGSDAAPRIVVTDGELNGGGTTASANVPLFTSMSFNPTDNNASGNNPVKKDSYFSDWKEVNSVWIPNGRRSSADAMAHTNAVAAVDNFKVTKGKMNIRLIIDGNSQWVNFQGFDIIFYGSTTGKLYRDLVELLETANTLKDQAMNAVVKTALTTAISNYSALTKSSTEEELTTAKNAVSEANTNAQTSIDIYTKINAAISTYATKADALDATGKAAYDATTIQTKYDNGTYTTLAEAEAELQAALVIAVKAQANPNNWTALITNPSFENNFTGWTNTGSMATQNNSSFTQKAGSKYVESWQPNGTKSVSQTIIGMPAGVYELSAAVYARGVTSAKIYAGGVEQPITVGADASTQTVRFACADNADITIGFEGVGTGAGSSWLCVDNFTLTLVNSDVTALTLSAVEGKMNADVAAAQNTPVSTFNSSKTVDNYNAAAAAINNAEASVIAYGIANTAITSAGTTKTAVTAETNFVAAGALTTYETTFTNAQTGYTNGTLTDAEAAAMATTLLEAMKTFYKSAWTSTNDVIAVNTWSTEGDSDGSSYTTPFIQYWVADAQTLADNTVITGSTTVATAGTYNVTAKVRMRMTNDGEGDLTGVSMQASYGDAVAITGAKNYGDFYVADVNATGYATENNGTLTVKFTINSTNASWLSIKAVKYERTGDVPAAEEADYTALAAAITAAETHTVGFEDGEYAPYNNVDALKALAAAKTINPSESNAKLIVNAATTALTGATWTANGGEVNAVYNGTFAATANDGAPAGWVLTGATGTGESNNTLGGSYRPRAFVLTSEAGNYAKLASFGQGDGTRSCFYFRFDDRTAKNAVYTYGATDGYTMPLKTGTTYKLTAKVGGWGKALDIKVAIVNTSDENIVAQTKTLENIDASGSASDYEMYFVVPTAGNYKLQLTNASSSSDNAAAISNIELKSTTDVVAATIGTTGYTTFASSSALDLSGISGGTAFYASAVGTSTITLTETTDKVPAGEGLILKGTAGDQVTIPVVGSGTAISGNKLVGCTSSTPLTANADYYVLVDESGAKFQSLADNGATIPAGKAYLNAAGTGARSLNIVFADETTGISTAKTAEKAGNEVYNLNGQRVAAPQKGLYIVNGKKVVIK